ncbi:unnamed protein product, partial [Rotaria sp. Silwood1]
NFDEDHQEMMTDYADDLQSIKVDQQEHEEEINELFINRNNYDEKTDLEFERFFRSRQTLVATCFDPITYRPASVLAFKQFPGGRQELVVTDSLLSVNHDRIILKRLVLSGHPFKIHK